jgi:hypothetical protein
VLGRLVSYFFMRVTNLAVLLMLLGVAFFKVVVIQKNNDVHKYLVSSETIFSTD